MPKMSLAKNCVIVSDISQNELQEFYPYHFNRNKTQFYISLYKIDALLNKFRPEAPLFPGNVMHIRREELYAKSAIDELKKDGPKESPVVTDSLVLRSHQQLGREIAQIRNRYAFYFDTRTGKTPLSLSIIYDDLIVNPNHKWLVVCPLILIENAWLEDIEKFKIPFSVTKCHNKSKVKRLQAMQENSNIYILNTESFANYYDLFEHEFWGIILDESSSMKSQKTAFAKAMLKASLDVERFYLLSGTPAPNGEYEYYMQLKSIDFYSVQQSFAQFKTYYFNNTSWNPQFEKLEMKEEKREEFNTLLKEYSIYVDKEDVLDTPGREFIEYTIDMPDDMAKVYKKFKREMAIEITEDNIVTADTAAVCINKLNQLASGFLINTEEQRVETFSSFRFDELFALIDTKELINEQVIIWANYRFEFEIIQKYLGTSAVVVNGTIPAEQKNENIKAFKSDKVQYLLANPASADKGLTLTNCHNAIYFNIGWSYEYYKQSLDRIYGDISIQPFKCNYYIMMAKGTVNEAIYREVLLGKQQSSTAVLNYLKGGL